MKAMWLLCAAWLGLGWMSSSAMASEEEALIVFPGQAKLRHHDEPKVLLVRFAEGLERRLFKAVVNGEDVTALVDPRPGQREVVLPFREGVNEVVFSARRVGAPTEPLQEARFSVRYRPPGDVKIEAVQSFTVPITPESAAILDQMAEASRAGDTARYIRLLNELEAMKAPAK